MAGQTFSNVVQYTEYRENPDLEDIVYYEKTTKTINFGYGINLTSLVTVNQQGQYSLPSWLNSILSNNLGINLNQSQLKSIMNSKSASEEAGNSIADGITTNASDDVQETSADTATQLFFQNKVIPGLEGVFGKDVFDNLPSNVQMGLEDAYYNGPGTVGPIVQGYINNNDYVAAAIELSNGTPSMSSNRSLFDALQILGYNPSIDDNNNIVGLTIAGVPVNGNVTSISSSETAFGEVEEGVARIGLGTTSSNASIFVDKYTNNAQINVGDSYVNVGVGNLNGVSYSNGTISANIGTSGTLTVGANGSSFSGPDGSTVFTSTYK